MKRFFTILLILLVFAPAQADDISDAYGGVGRILVIVSWGEEDEYVGFGSGFAVTPTEIVTNYHVVELYAQYASSAEQAVLAVVPSHGTQPLQARLKIYDSSKDLAILEIVGGTMEPMTLYSGAPELGRRYTALGFPSNVDLAASRDEDELFDATVTPRSPIRTGGDISEARPVRGIDAYVHDADIAGGNSGGPLVDQCGRVIGVNEAVASASESDSASSFAISYRELSRFLRRAEVRFQSDGSACVTSEDRARICTAQREEARADALSECLAGARDSSADSERDYRRRQERARSDGETVMFAAMAIMLFGALGLGAAGLLATRGQRNYAIAAGAGGGVLIIGAIVLFALRPSAIDIEAPESRPRDCRAMADRIAERFESEQCPSEDAQEETDAAPTPEPPAPQSKPNAPASETEKSAQ